MFPTQILYFIGKNTGMNFFNELADAFGRGNFTYYFVFALLIFIFSYFWVSRCSNPFRSQTI